jgi:hypothetical protein
MARAGKIIIIEDKPDTLDEQIEQAKITLVKIRHGQAPITGLAGAAGVFTSYIHSIFKIHGPGTPRPRSIFHPQRQGLVEAAFTLVTGKRERPAEFYNVQLVVDEVQKDAEETQSMQQYADVLTESQQMIDNHLWPREVRLYGTLDTSWDLLGPLFEKSKDLQRWGTRLYTYMTERFKKGAQTRQDREEVAKAVEASKAAEMRAKAEKEARDKVAGELADAFVRKLDRDSDKPK